MEEEKERKDITENKDLQNIKELGTQSIPKSKDRIQILPIIGQIEGHVVLPPQTKSTRYEHVIPLLVAIENDPNVEGVLVILNTVGGDVEAGLAISEMIRSLSKPTVSLVIGGGHSIGVPLATSADYSFISPSATMIVHPIRMNGLVIGAPQTFEYFNKMQERIIEFVVRTSQISRDRIRKLMAQTDELLNDMGTILIGKQAVDEGLIDEVGGISDAIKKLEELLEERKADKTKTENKENQP
ncbi:ATP-dependent Clp protease proteolytic subunit [Clostridium sp. PL3]|uniref:ATP-dependent Clp protease proteolytic subunit n=1 Tax=Clostridium thailandense TaxID=2794346 RepID=A0A949TWK3_9CLOT|nr:ATP-dependent Clp protease proteolytic subunit [Clostridium thailandense]MBV7274916.1 ATP-dependent Clp protease proteolytic subunit [Clostridium thailandense]